MSKFEIDDKNFEQEHQEFTKPDQPEIPQIEGNVQLIDERGQIRLIPTPRQVERSPFERRSHPLIFGFVAQWK